MTLHLAGARANAEKFMVDACTVTRDAAGPNDDLFDTQTGLYHPQFDDPVAVYAGKCAVGLPTPGTQIAWTDSSGRALYASPFRIRIPAAAGPFQIGDAVTVTSSAEDPHLAGVVLTVTDVPAGTFRVSRILTAIDRTRGPRT